MHKYFNKTLFLFFLLLNSTVKADVDSLKYQLLLRPNDSVKILLYSNLFDELRNTNHKEAKHYAYLGITTAQRSNNPKALSKLYHNLGSLYYLTAEYPIALQCYLRALRIREDHNDSSNIAKSYNNIGLVYFEEKNFVEALQFHLRSIAIKEKLNDHYGMALSYGNIGNIYIEWAKDNKSDSSFQKSSIYQIKALEILEKLSKAEPENTKYLLSLGSTYNNLGNITLEMAIENLKGGNLEQSLNYHLKAIKIQEKIEDVRGLGHSYINLGAVKTKQRKYNEAIEFYNKAIKLAGEYDLKETVKTAYEALSNLYEKTRDFPMSLFYLKKYNSLKDSILDVSKSEQIAELQVKFDAEKQTKEIELLNKNKVLQDVELKRQTLLRNSFIIGVLLLVTLVFVIYKRYRLKNQTSIELQIKMN